MTHVSGNKIGKFMVAIGAIIENPEGKILILKRTDEFHKDTWEVMYGRIDQFEELDEALAREVYEETGLTDLQINKLLRIWHVFRGEKKADKEIYGLTFYCTTSKSEVHLSSEHSEYRWVTPTEAYDLIEPSGIRQEVKFFMENKANTKLAITSQTGEMKYLFG